MRARGDARRILDRHRRFDGRPLALAMGRTSTRALETDCGRNEYPVRAMGNALLAGVVFQHPRVETLRRELARNGPRRELCGFTGKTPSTWPFSRCFRRLIHHSDAVDALFDELVETLQSLLPPFGERLAVDS